LIFACSNAADVEGTMVVGGLVGAMQDTNFTGCGNSGDVMGSSRVGGIYGTANRGGLIAGRNTGRVTGTQFVGGLGGYNVATSNIDSVNFGDVSGTGQETGGVCGVNGGVVERCYNTGAVSGQAKTGGVVGRNAAAITASYNVGAVTGTVAVGGVCGQNNGSISNSYNQGNIEGDDAVGGVAGEILEIGFADVPPPVTAGANYGTVTATGGVAGGVAGLNGGAITACYNTGAVAAASGVAGGVAGKNTVYKPVHPTSGYVPGYWMAGAIRAAYNTGTVTGTTVGGVLGLNGYDGGEPFSCAVENSYWYISTPPPSPTNGIGQNDVPPGDLNNGCTRFTSSFWPNATMLPGWAAGTYGDYWKTLGSAMDSPDPTNLPKLRWER
jgi:hypothetical protein